LIVQFGVGMDHLLKKSVPFYLVNLTIQCSTIIAITYLNAFIYMPKFLKDGRLINYAFVLLVSVLFFVTISLVMDYIEMDVLKLTEVPFSKPDWHIILFRSLNIGRFLVFAFLLYALNEKSIQSKLIEQIKVEKLQSEISQLKAQINPHFLFNTLNNVYGLALEKSEKTPEIILKLSSMMDYMLYESTDMFVSLKRDMENVTNYIEIEKIRKGSEAEIQIEIHGAIENQKVAPLMLLPLIENAFKHGLGRVDHGAFVRILISIKGMDLLMKVQNNYNYPEQGSKELGHDLGLSNLRKRLELFYPDKHELVIDNNPPFFNVFLRLTLND
jgi:two-component system LytT family sensor kinase